MPPVRSTASRCGSMTPKKPRSRLRSFQPRSFPERPGPASLKTVCGALRDGEARSGERGKRAKSRAGRRPSVVFEVESDDGMGTQITSAPKLELLELATRDRIQENIGTFNSRDVVGRYFRCVGSFLSCVGSFFSVNQAHADDFQLSPKQADL